MSSVCNFTCRPNSQLPKSDTQGSIPGPMAPEVFLSPNESESTKARRTAFGAERVDRWAGHRQRSGALRKAFGAESLGMNDSVMAGLDNPAPHRMADDARHIDARWRTLIEIIANAISYAASPEKTAESVKSRVRKNCLFSTTNCHKLLRSNGCREQNRKRTLAPTVDARLRRSIVRAMLTGMTLRGSDVAPHRTASVPAAPNVRRWRNVMGARGLCEGRAGSRKAWRNPRQRNRRCRNSRNKKPRVSPPGVSPISLERLAAQST